MNAVFRSPPIPWLMRVVASALFVCHGGYTAAAAGNVDASFATGGLYIYPHTLFESGPSRNLSQVLALARGESLALGGLYSGPLDGSGTGTSESFALSSAGVLDTAFATAGRLPYLTPDPLTGFEEKRFFTAARELANGAVLLVSNSNRCVGSIASCFVIAPRTAAILRVRRYLSSGAPDTTYSQVGLFEQPLQSGGAAILSDGSVIALGATYNFPGVGVGGILAPYTFQATVVNAAGTRDTNLEAQFLQQIIRCSPTGGPVISGSPPFYLPFVDALAGDKILFAFRGCMLRLNKDGTPDTTFGGNGLSQADDGGYEVVKVLTLKDGSSLSFLSAPSTSKQFRVIKRLPSGTLDTSFGVGGIVSALSLPYNANPPVFSIFGFQMPNSGGLPALDSQDRILFGITDSNTGNTALPRSYLARFDSSLHQDMSFGDPSSGLAPLFQAGNNNLSPSAVAVDPTGRLLVAGSLLSYPEGGNPYGTYTEAVMRLQADPVSVVVPPPAPVSSGGGGGGCGMVRDVGRPDPTFYALLSLAILALGRRRLRRIQVQEVRPGAH